MQSDEIQDCVLSPSKKHFVVLTAENYLQAAQNGQGEEWMQAAAEESMGVHEENETKFEGMFSTPQPGSRWKHTNGIQYIVQGLTNTKKPLKRKYPVTIVYVNEATREVHSRFLADWYRSFTPD